MLSTLVLLQPSSSGIPVAVSALVRTLSSLVPGTIGGVVRDVTIVTGRRDAEVHRVADHAGCALVERDRFEDALQAAIAQARCPTLFLLRAGALVNRALLEEVAVSIDGESAATPFVLRLAPEGFVRRVLPELAPAAGLIARASAMDASAKDFETLVRRVTGKKTLSTRAAMAS